MQYLKQEEQILRTRLIPVQVFVLFGQMNML